MPNIILPSNSASADELRVATALNFMGATTSSSRFRRTNASSGSSTQATLSAWVKYETTNTQSVPIFMAPDAAGNDRFYINITSAQEMGGTHRNPDCDFSSTDDVKLRDPAAWYHIVAAINTNDSTAADRVKIYVNNERITLTFATGGGLGSGANIHFNTSGYKNTFGYNDVTNDGVTNLSDLYFAEVIKCDGQVLAPTDFAEYDSNGVWVPKTDLADTLTFGTTGYYYNFADSSDLGNDVSGNNNDASDMTSTTQSLDTPSNSYAVMNPLDNYYAGSTFSNGNRQVQSTTSGKAFNLSTIAVSQGKWYWEVKFSASGGTTPSDKWNYIGITDRSPTSSSDELGGGAYQYAVFEHDGKVYNNGSGVTYGAAFNTGDIIQIALDLDNNNIYFGVGGQWGNGSGSWNQSTPSSAISIGDPTATLNGVYFAAFGDAGVNVNKTWQANFGNPPFTISSGNSDGNGYGNFEYAVPDGYFALNTKNLAEYG